ncbi:hypothetical protein FKW77_006364 [Venturia effusa]|uniref:Uncharacterized protein n=1 Tax=Venturia effusa TaxID=50376 RepID=A0A517L3H4_9PEZI|nr:hypothetical protein FKW77_006364 [Venturia effusa]
MIHVSREQRYFNPLSNTDTDLAISSCPPRDAQLKLIIGIDFGTSNSGASYTLFQNQDDRTPEVRIILGWPRGQSGDSFRQASEKVPSEIAYDKHGLPHFGWDIPPDLDKIQWVKLLLEEQPINKRHPGTQRIRHAQRTENARNILKRLNKTAVDVTADYLSWLWAHIQKTIATNEDDESIFLNAATTIVLTLPAAWSDQAKDNTVKAAEKARLTHHGRTLKFISEPEAAAIFSCQQKVLTGQIKVGDCVILCDAGGGTVDVVSYKLQSAKPLVLEQCAIAYGDLCGSVFVDAAFENQLRSALGEEWTRLRTNPRAKIFETFEYAIKRNYGSEGASKNYFIDLPDAADDPKRNIRKGKYKIDSAMLNTSFESIMGQVMILIDDQRDELRRKGLDGKLKGVLLVGGFGASNFLHNRVRQEFPSSEGVKIWQADQSWTSVVRGAVMCEYLGLGAVTPVNTRLSRWNFGVTYSTTYNPQEHDLTDQYKDPETGALKARNQVDWLVRKGDQISAETRIKPHFFSLKLTEDDKSESYPGYLVAWIDIFRNGDDIAPTRKTDELRDSERATV